METIGDASVSVRRSNVRGDDVSVVQDIPSTRVEIEAAARRLGSAESLVASVLEIAGARALALDALLRVSAFEWSGEVTTAMVECADRPRILMNPVFVERWCATRERLAALLLHELSHVSMGHTRLFPRPTVAHNIAFDALINRELLATALGVGASATGMAALFIDYYVPDASPWFLLRPPPGWPGMPDWHASKRCPAQLRDIHRRLYSTDAPRVRGAVGVNEIDGSRHTVMYGEIIAALRAATLGGGGARAGPGESLDDVSEDSDDILARLLGAHGSTPLEQSGISGGRDARAANVLGSVLERLVSGTMAGSGGAAHTLQVQRVARRAALQRALTELIRRATRRDETGSRAIALRERPIRNVDMSRDRRAPARVALARTLGAPRPFLFDSSIVVQGKAPGEALVYLDVSGSMGGYLPILHASLVPLRRELRPRIHVFSTEVVEVSAHAFDSGRLPTMGGTSITPVLEHLVHTATSAPASTSRTRTAVVLTDGYFDAPSPSLAREVVARGMRVHLGVSGGGPLHAGESWVGSATRLPTL